MTKRIPVLAILSLLMIAAPAGAQTSDAPPEAGAPVLEEPGLEDPGLEEPGLEELAGPVRVEAPPFVEPVPFIAAGPPTLNKAVKAMIEEAIRRDDSKALSSVVKVAIATQPYDVKEIKAMHKAYLDRKAKALAEMTKQETERIRRSGVLELWEGQIELGAFRSTGNTSNFGFTGALKLDRKGIDWQHTVLLNADYQKDSGKVTREKYGASYQPRYTLNDGLFTYGRTQFEKNEIQGIRDRYSLSGGLGYRVLKRRNMDLSLEAGPAVRHTLYVTEPSETTWSMLTSLEFNWKVNGTLKLTQNASSYVGSDDNTFTSLTGVEAGLAKGLKAKMSYSFQHETSPPDGTLKTDTISRFSLVYGF